MQWSRTSQRRAGVDADYPRSPGTGIVFRRIDLDGFEIEAISRNVARVSYATSLMKKGVLISTTSTCSRRSSPRRGQRNCGNRQLELPILDGSALPFVELIQEAGLRKQRRPGSISRFFAK